LSSASDLQRIRRAELCDFPEARAAQQDRADDAPMTVEVEPDRIAVRDRGVGGSDAAGTWIADGTLGEAWARRPA
jgi:hypothetical protein